MFLILVKMYNICDYTDLLAHVYICSVDDEKFCNVQVSILRSSMEWRPTFLWQWMINSL